MDLMDILHTIGMAEVFQISRVTVPKLALSDMIGIQGVLKQTDTPDLTDITTITIAMETSEILIPVVMIIVLEILIMVMAMEIIMFMEIGILMVMAMEIIMAITIHLVERCLVIIQDILTIITRIIPSYVLDTVFC